MIFWALALVISVLIAVIIGLSMVRGQQAVSSGEDGGDVALYKAQLAELERDQKRGLLSAEEAEAARLEVSRRLLEADKRASQGQSGSADLHPLWAWAAGAAILASSFGLYFSLGAGQYPDMPHGERLEQAADYRANRPAQALVEAEVGERTLGPDISSVEHQELMVKLRAALKDRPDDLAGHELLARNEAALGKFKASHEALAQIIRIKGADAESGDYFQMGEMMVLAAGGYVSPEAEVAFNKAIELDPRNGSAAYYIGLMYAQTGRPDEALELWSDMLDGSDATMPWVRPIRAQIEQVAADAGIAYELPPARVLDIEGPSLEEIEAAQEMTPEDRQEMIEGMVANLSDRLATRGGTPQEWAQLIRSLGMLGRQREAKIILREAQDVFAAQPDDLQILRDAADSVGVLEE